MISLFSHATGDEVMGFLDEHVSTHAQLNVTRALPSWLSWNELRGAPFE